MITQTIRRAVKTYSEPCQISRMKHFAKTVNGLQLLTIFTKSFTVDFLHGSEYAYRCTG